MTKMKILSIESSCDETAAAITEDGRKVISSVIATQIDEHKLYGGVVPEIASRRHCENITGVCAEALEKADMTLDEIDAIAVTNAPGLIGALLVGVNFAKGLALAKNKPLIAVHHIKGHIAANYITHPELEPPYLCLVVSGGHSHIVKVNSYTELETVGKTTDDAAGEAFDKAARAMGFQYPGGVHIDRAAKQGDASKIEAAKTFIDFIAADPDQVGASVLASTYFPVRSSVGDIYAGNDIMSEYSKFMNYLGDYYQITPGWATARTEWWNMLQRVGTGEAVETAVATFVENANAAAAAEA